MKEGAEVIKTYQDFLSFTKGTHGLKNGSYYNFFRDMWAHVPINEDNFEDNWHIKFICDEIEKVARRVMEGKGKEYDLLINVPPGSSKTTICTILFPVWVWTQKPWMRVLTGSFDGSMSLLHASLSRDVIRDDFFQALYGGEVVVRPDIDAKSFYMNTAGGYRKATSTGANVTGAHAHLIIVDDPLNPKGAKSEKVMEGATDWVNKTLSTRKVDKRNTPTIMIMQRLHEKDPAGDWLKKKGENGKRVKSICLPANMDFPIEPGDEEVEWNGVKRTVKEWYKYNGGYLDPKRMGKEVLRDARIDLGSVDFGGQFGQQPIDAEGNVVKRSWFPIVPYHKLPKKVKGMIRDTVVDTGDKAQEKNDPSGFLSYCTYKGYLFIFDWMTLRALFPERVEGLKGFVDKNGRDGRVWIEPKVSGNATVQYLQLYSPYSVLEWEMAAGNKEERLKAISPKIEAGKCILVEGGWNDSFLHEVCGFPRVEHDEAVDCLTMAGINSWLRGVTQGYKHIQ